MDSEKEKNRLSDIVLERVGLTGNLLSAPVSPSPEPAVDMPGHERQVRAGKVTGPRKNTRGGFWFPLPSLWSGRPRILTGGCTAGSPCWSGPPVAAASPGLSSGCWSSIWRNIGRISPPCSVRSTVPGMRTGSRENRPADKMLSLSKKIYHDRKERKRPDGSRRDGRGPHP